MWFRRGLYRQEGNAHDCVIDVEPGVEAVALYLHTTSPQYSQKTYDHTRIVVQYDEWMKLKAQVDKAFSKAYEGVYDENKLGNFPKKEQLPGCKGCKINGFSTAGCYMFTVKDCAREAHALICDTCKHMGKAHCIRWADHQCIHEVVPVLEKRNYYEKEV
jgi:hypothetical protein